MDELAYSLNGENMHYGTPENPAAPDRVPGGSSSGSAVATAAGDVDFAVGSDTGGEPSWAERKPVCDFYRCRFCCRSHSDHCARFHPYRHTFQTEASKLVCCRITGSVRVPASYCGILGMRPSHGRASLEGACPLGPSFDTCESRHLKAKPYTSLFFPCNSILCSSSWATSVSCAPAIASFAAHCGQQESLIPPLIPLQ